MRRRVLAAAAAALLALPVALAFFHGGYDPDARLAGGIAAWLLAAVAAVAAPEPLPRTGPARLALAGLTALLVLTIASLAWAPLAAVAYADAQRVALYLGALVAGAALLRAAPDHRVAVAPFVAPALAAGAFAIVLVGLLERLVPWLVALERSGAAGGRLQAPLGYWNAMGAVAAIGLALSAGVAGDASRSPRARALAAAAAPVLGAGLVLSFSRGAILAAAAGLAIVLLARPSPAQLRAAVVTAAAAGIAAVVAALLPAVKDLDGARTAQGAVLIAVVVAASAAAAAVAAGGSTRTVTLPRPRLLAAAAAVIVLGCVALVVAADAGRDDPAFGATAERLGSVQSNRFDYWEVAITTWTDDPLIGAGSGAFQVAWLRERDIAEGARDAHSLPLETAAELGVAGLLALAALVAGVLAAAVQLQQAAPGAGAGTFGGLAAWSVHVSLDWGWEMPSVSLFAVLMAAALIPLPRPRPARAPPAPR